MMSALRRGSLVLWAVMAIAALLLSPAVYAGNDVMGEIEFEGKTKVERTSGVWIDGGYVGYLKELKGSKKVLLLPGEHVISVRQDGYQNFEQRVEVQPGQKYLVRVQMQKALTQPMPAVTATVKIEVNPNRAAVFVDGQFVGHVGEFEGAGRGMLVAPGAHKIRVALPGYQTFETEINALANQKVEVKTDLVKSNAGVEDPMLNPAGNDHAAPVPPPDRATPPPPPDRATPPPPPDRAEPPQG
jgi:PEGA domain